MQEWKTFSDIVNAARKGNPVAFDELSKMALGEVRRDGPAHTAIRNFEREGVGPVLETSLPEIKPRLFPSLKKIVGNLVGRYHQRKTDRGNGTLGV